MNGYSFLNWYRFFKPVHFQVLILQYKFYGIKTYFTLASCGLTRKCQESFGCVWVVGTYVLVFEPHIHVLNSSVVSST